MPIVNTVVRILWAVTAADAQMALCNTFITISVSTRMNATRRHVAIVPALTRLVVTNAVVRTVINSIII